MTKLAALSAGVGGPALRRKLAKCADVEALARRLNHLCTAPPMASRLRDALKEYVDSGGALALELAPETAAPAAAGRPR